MARNLSDIVVRAEAKQARPDDRAQRRNPESYPLEYVEDFFGPRTIQMTVDRSPQ